jgi:hypothetical protein
MKIAIIYNGIGIAKEYMDRIFGHGFTTRKDGHCFGLQAVRWPPPSGALTGLAKDPAGEPNSRLNCLLQKNHRSTPRNIQQVALQS